LGGVIFLGGWLVIIAKNLKGRKIRPIHPLHWIAPAIWGIAAIIIAITLYLGIAPRFLIWAPFQKPNKIFSTNTRYQLISFQISKDGKRIYYYDKGSVYLRNIEDNAQNEKLICRILPEDSLFVEWKFSISPDEKYIAYLKNTAITILSLVNGEKCTLGFDSKSVTSVVWSNAAKDQIYISYVKGADFDIRSGIDAFSPDFQKRQEVMKERDGYVQICQILPDDAFIYLYGNPKKMRMAYRLFDTFVGGDYEIFAFPIEYAINTGVFPENKIRFSSNRKWCAVSFWQSVKRKYKGIWIVHMKDRKAIMVLQNRSTFYYKNWNDLLMNGIDWDFKKKHLFFTLNFCMHSFNVSENSFQERSIIPGYTSRIQLYCMSIEQALRIFEEHPERLVDFSDIFAPAEYLEKDK